MKHLLVSFFLFLVFNNSFSEKYWDFDWTKLEHKLTDDEKRANIKLLTHWIIEHLNSYPFPFLDDKDLLENFHFMDFTGDGKLDIVYYGPSGAESFITIFFEKKDTDYQECLSFYGIPIEIYKPACTYPAIIRMYESGCCEDPVSSIQLFIPTKNEKGLIYKMSTKHNFIKNTLYPSSLDRSKRFRIINESYHLRLNPTIEDAGKNIVATYPEGTEGIALAEETDSSGRIWWFVAIEPTDKILKTSLHGGINNENNYYSLGWMSSRFVKEIQ